MIDRPLLVFLCIVAGTFFLFHESVLATIWLAIFSALLFAYRDPKITLAGRWLGQEWQTRSVELEDYVKDKPEMLEALRYVTSLDSDSFMHFSSLAVQIRYQRDQEILTRLARQFRSEKGAS